MNSVASKNLVAESPNEAVTGEFVNFAGERYYAIKNVDRMAPFFISVVSDDDHWLFVSSTGGLTAGRVSPETALFPYITVDRIHESTPHTGCETIIRASDENGSHSWEPFNREHDGRYCTTRNLYKYILGNKICFEEINHDLGLTFRYFWLTSDEFGFVRHAEIENLDDSPKDVELLDGLLNILPAGTPRFTQTNSSNLVDAYKWTELDEESGLAFLTLYSGITDRAEPAESLKATTAFCIGLDDTKTLISSNQVNAFRHGDAVTQETQKRGIRGAYLVNSRLSLSGGETRGWDIVTNLEQGQAEAVALRQRLKDTDALREAIRASIERGSDRLARIMAGSDAFQATREENVSAHHYANVLFNILRGGVFVDQYSVPAADFRQTVRIFNKIVYAENRDFLDALPEELGIQELIDLSVKHGDAQIRRLAQEYLPITFGRRHGDPSRPWNQFAINLKDEDGNEILSYQGNWRDIFQNWEALALSYPTFVESMIAKFVNASTADGYNPYRIMKDGIDWEVEEPDNPWSYIGYWGDHQIIYLQKLLELSHQFWPDRLGNMLRERIFCYANVPYRIKPFEDLLEDPKATVLFDEDLEQRVERRVAEIGSDGKLLMDADERVYQVNLAEKLLVPLLAKLSNLVVDGGIWLNTQRPEWNDANNALVGHGLSMVTLYYMRRYVVFLQELLGDENDDFEFSKEVATWLAETVAALGDLRDRLEAGDLTADGRYEALEALGTAASRCRETVYAQDGLSGVTSQPVEPIRKLLGDALVAIDRSIGHNRRDDGLYDAYNLLDLRGKSIEIQKLYKMLEGQVAILSAGAISAEEAVRVVEALFDSDIYRANQNSFMLYPDRELPGFLQKNRVPLEKIQSIPLLSAMLERGDHRVILKDADGNYRFDSDFANVSDLKKELDEIGDGYPELEASRGDVLSLFEDTFQHKAFTGRSGTMFGFEGLGSIYWHMVAKLLLAIMENFFSAHEHDADATARRRLGELYYQVREGIGFNKTPTEYGAFPTDPYSHSPGHAGARQPGMTGQVKEEILTRFGELGVRVKDGIARFDPALLRQREFLDQPRDFTYLDVDDEWQQVHVPAGSIGFTWCQVPVLYTLDAEAGDGRIEIRLRDGSGEMIEGTSLPADACRSLFERNGHVRQITVNLSADRLFSN